MKNLFLSLILALSVGTSHTLTDKNSRQKADSVLICQSKSAHAYHSYICSGLSRCKHKIIKMSKEDAIKAGYKPCGFCYK